MVDEPGGPGGGWPDDAVDWSPALKRALAQSPDEIGRLMIQLQGRVNDADTLLDLMSRASREAVRMIADAHGAGVTARFAGEPFTAAHTDDAVLLIDEGQYDEGDGPCLSAARSDRRVAVTLDDVRVRWPLVAAAAAQVGVRSFLAEPLHVRPVVVGSLNLYSRREGGLRVPEPDVLVVLLDYLDRGLADYLAAQPGEAPARTLVTALRRRQLVNQAAGVTMARHGVDIDQAFGLIEDEARRRGVDVGVVAADIVGPTG
ncbi:GAF and ANTAR domain-containing protein [Nakamurella deserti]|uniref:GAF and ANTAR domain-containing protein n=1 Tax=Nakamurella deserti TaxID=2164074 RepID=UPI000DBE3A15|nr:GAF and ANTAR domain-containing protein [Nakamurella deserti]